MRAVVPREKRTYYTDTEASNKPVNDLATYVLALIHNLTEANAFYICF